MTLNNILNIHTHIPMPNAIFNYDILGTRNNCYQNQNNLCSIGIHPWDSELIRTDKIKPLFKQFKPTCNVVAIGECGLDRACKSNFVKQIDIFILQLELATEYNLPVIVHCVRAWSDVIPIINKFSHLTYIFHNYRANVHQTTKLLKYKTYFSFGKSMFKPTEKIKKVLEIIPKEKILIETDEEYLNIETVLDSVCLVLNTEKQLLRKQLIENSKSAFNL